MRQPMIKMRPAGMTTLAWELMERSKSLHALRHKEGQTWEDCHYLPCFSDKALLATPEAAAGEGYRSPLLGAAHE